MCLDLVWTAFGFADDDEAEMELINTANGSMAAHACGSECHEQSDRGPAAGDFRLVFLNIALSAMRNTCNRITLTGSLARLWSSWRSRSVWCSWRATLVLLAQLEPDGA